MRRRRFEWALKQSDQNAAKVSISNGTIILREQEISGKGKIIEQLPAGSGGVKWVYVDLQSNEDRVDNQSLPESRTVCSIKIFKQTVLFIYNVVQVNVDQNGVAYVVTDPAMKTQDEFYWEMERKSNSEKETSNNSNGTD